MTDNDHDEEMYRLRMGGTPARAIAAQFGVTIEHVEEAIAARCMTISPAARLAALRLELERLDLLSQTYFLRGVEGDVAAAALALKISERRASMWGLDAPLRVEPIMLANTVAPVSGVDKIMLALNQIASSNGSNMPPPS
jgi:hypothetical protein